MSISFYAYPPDKEIQRYLCQCVSFNIDGKKNLRLSREVEYGKYDPGEVEDVANKSCRDCKGKGVEEFPLIKNELNMSNNNAIAFMRFLGMAVEYNGEMSLPEARRMVIKARNTRKKFDDLIRPTEKIMRPFVRGDGTTEIYPAVTSYGIDEEYLWEKLEKFEEIIDDAVKNKKEKIIWS